MLEFTIVVDAEDVPAAVMKTVRQAAEGAVIGRIEYIEISYEIENGRVVKLPETVISYAVEITRGDKTAEIVVNPDGTAIEPAAWGDAEEQ